MIQVKGIYVMNRVLYAALQVIVTFLPHLCLCRIYPIVLTAVYLQALSSSSRLSTFKVLFILNPEKREQYPVYWHEVNIF